jgi:hypothetical protein
VITLTLTNNTFVQNDAPSGSNLYYEQVNEGSMTTNLYNNILLKGTSGGNCYILNDSFYVTSTVGINSCATITGVNELSVWTLAVGQPTAIMFDALAARAAIDVERQRLLNPALSVERCVTLMLQPKLWD